MKRITIMAFCLILMSLAVAQDYRPMLKDGRVWNFYWTNGHHEGHHEMSISGDSLINGEKWFRLYYSFQQWGIDSVVGKTDTLMINRFLNGLLREKDRQVLYIDRNGQQSMLYDFNLKSGDSWYQGVYGPGITERIIADGIDSITSQGIAYRRIRLKAFLEYATTDWSESNTDYEYGYWLEGIGCTRGLLSTTGWFTPSGRTSLLSCYDGDRCIFSADDIVEIKPTSVKNLVLDDTDKPGIFYDLQGRRLSGEPRSGVYIRNGKKYVRH